MWPFKRKQKRPATINNCARVYVGHYVGGGTNEFERSIVCGYKVLSGEVFPKKLKPIHIRGTNSEGTMFTLHTFVLYPETDTALVHITNGKRRVVLNLIKAERGEKSTMFKLRL